MSRWADAFAAFDDTADTSDTIDKTPSQTEGEPNCVDYVYCVTPSGAAVRGRVAAPADHNVSDSSGTTTLDDPKERAALIEYGTGVPRRWAEGYAALCSMGAPSGFYPERWQRIVDAAGTFLDQSAAKAITCGWSDLDVFGCDPDKPDRRFDCMGLLLLLDRCEIVGIDEHGADLIAIPGEAQLRYRRRPLPLGTVSLWQLAPLSPRDSDAR